MVSRGEDKYVVYPIYFDKSVSRLSGRRVPIKNAVDKPSLEDISKSGGIEGFDGTYYVGGITSAYFRYNSYNIPDRFILTDADTQEEILDTGLVATRNWQTFNFEVGDREYINLTIIGGASDTAWSVELGCIIEE